MYLAPTVLSAGPHLTSCYASVTIIYRNASVTIGVVMAYEIECEICGEWFEAQRSTGRYCRSACRQEAYRERKESGRVYPEEELADLRQQIWSLVRFAEYQGQGLAPLSMLADVRDPDLTRIGHVLDQLQVFREFG